LRTESFVNRENGNKFEVEIVDSVASYWELMQKLFDFDAINKLVARKDFSMLIDGMHGAVGPYATKLKEMLGFPEESLMRCNCLKDFGCCHPDPNLTYAGELVKAMGLCEHE